MSTLDQLREQVGDKTDPARRVEALVIALADMIKATSNDQNVQRLSRELRATASALAAAVAPPAQV